MSLKVMNRSFSMPVKPRQEEFSKKLKRYQQNDKLDEQIENEYEIQESEFCADDQLYYKEKKILNPKGHWYGSSIIELSNKEKSDETDQMSFYRNKNFIRNKYNLSKRLICKNGHQNVKFKNTSKYFERYFKDIITTLIEQHWVYTLSWFTASFLITWLGFALLWYLIAINHGDLDFDEFTGKCLNNTIKPCVVGVKNMVGMFMHSFEISSTVGFGERYPTEECPEGIILFVIQIIISIGIDGAMVAVVYAKTAKPIKLITKFIFSKTACVHLRDNKLCLVFRICDPREQKSIETKIRVYFVTDIETIEGEILKVNKELKLEGNGNMLIMWPEIICHVIDQQSPFYKYSAQDFNTKEFEILVSLVGHSPITGLQTESRTSYLPQEITWGQRFTNIIFYDPSKYNYIIDYDHFHTTFAVDTSTESAFHRYRKLEIS